MNLKPLHLTPELRNNLGLIISVNKHSIYYGDSLRVIRSNRNNWRVEVHFTLSTLIRSVVIGVYATEEEALFVLSTLEMLRE